MKILYVAYSTEYEAGWGSRPDGFILTEEKSIIEAEIEKVFTQGSYECYWRYSSIDKVICDEETWNKIKNDFEEGKYYSSSNSLKSVGSFYKEV